MKQLLLVFLSISLSFLSKEILAQNQTSDEQGYNYLKTYCYACHNPQVESRDKMIAPPMIRVKQHYLPVFQNKKDFVNAVVEWVKHPSKEAALMPGAVRKFNIMPPLAYPDEVLRAIAVYMYDNELEQPKMMGMHEKGKGMQHDNIGSNLKNNMPQSENSDITLNNGEKWDVDDDVIKTMNDVLKKLKEFNGNKVDDYNNLGKDVFDQVKIIIMNQKNTGDSFSQLQNFFHGMEKYMHQLMAVKSPEEGKKYKTALEKYIGTFDKYFK